MQDSVVKFIMSGAFAVATVVWFVQSRRATSQPRSISSERSANSFHFTSRAYKASAIAVAASWVLIPVSIWGPNQQVWSTAGGLLVSLSMVIQFRAEGRKRLAKISIWTTALSGICLSVFLLLMVFAHDDDAGTASAGAVGRGSSPRVMVGPYDHSPSPIPDSGATPRQ